MSDIENIQSVQIFVKNNPNPLVATFTPTSYTLPLKIRTRIKVYKNSTMSVIIKAGDKYYSADHVFSYVIYHPDTFESHAGENLGNVDFRPEASAIGKIKAIVQRNDSGVELISMIAHPTESGLARNKKTGKPIPPHFIKEFKASYKDKVIFSGQMNTSWSTNPYMSIALNDSIMSGEEIVLRYFDSDGNIYTNYVNGVLKSEDEKYVALRDSKNAEIENKKKKIQQDELERQSIAKQALNDFSFPFWNCPSYPDDFDEDSESFNRKSSKRTNCVTTAIANDWDKLLNLVEKTLDGTMAKNNVTITFTVPKWCDCNDKVHQLIRQLNQRVTNSNNEVEAFNVRLDEYNYKRVEENRLPSFEYNSGYNPSSKGRNSIEDMQEIVRESYRFNNDFNNGYKNQ